MWDFKKVGLNCYQLHTVMNRLYLKFIVLGPKPAQLFYLGFFWKAS